MSVSSFSSAAKPGVCLSTDRPNSPFDGQVIYETDTNRTLVYDNSAWVVIHDPTLMSYSGTGVTVTADAASIGGENVTPYTGRRNLLYNGAMQVAQRGTSTTGISNATHQYYTADRYTTTILNSIGTWTNSVVSDAPDGFGKSLKMTCTTAQASPGSTAAAFLAQKLEGQDLQGLAKGTSSAKEVTLSFWVKSNVTGTYVISLYDFDNSGRTVSKQYTISSADTWEHKTLTYPADTTGAFNNDNGVSLQITIWLAGGSNYTSGTLNETWNSYVAANEAVGQTNLASAVNNYIQFTGLQLELGDKATPFEHRSYGEELALCERYYQVGSVVPQTSGNSGSYFQTTGSNNFGAINTVAFRTRMRTVPTMGWNFTSTDNAAVTQYYVNQDSCGIRVIANNTGFLYCSYYASFGASAEL